MKARKKEKFATKLAHQLYISLIVIIISFLVGFSLLITGSFMVISRSENSYNNAIIEQINNNTERMLVSNKNATRELAYSKNLHDYLTPTQEQGYIANKVDALKRFESEASLLLGYTGDIVAIIIKSDISAEIVRGNGDIDNDAYSKNVVIDSNIKGQYFLQPYYDNRIYSYLLPIIMPIYSEYDDEGMQTKLGNCILLSDISFFYESVDSLKEDASIDLFLIDKEGKVVIGDPDVYADKINYNGEGTGESKFRYNSNKYVVAIRHMDVADYSADSVFSIVAVLRKSMPKNNIYFFIIAFACMIPSMVVIVLSFGKAKRNIGYSIGEIKDFTKQISDVNFKNRMDYSPNSDYRGIYENINILLDKYTNISDNLVESEMLKNQAELNMLKSQVNPHFLFNTLECIRGISAEYGAKEISEIAYSMAQILRYSISGGNFSKISEELNIVRNYLRIMNIRTKDKVRYKIDVQEDILDLSIIKMALQLLVENCFKHGTKSKNMDEITVLGKREGDFIIFEISDNGSGLGQEEMDKLKKKIENCCQANSCDIKNNENLYSNKSHGMGLANIQKRLLILHGQGSGISLSTSESGGFKVLLRYRIKQI